VVVALDDAVGELDRLDALVARCAVDLLAVLVGAGEKVDPCSLRRGSGEDVGHDGGVDVADVRHCR